MKVSKIEIIPVRPHQGLIGFATIALDDDLLLSSIAIHSKLDGKRFRLTYPTRGHGKSALTLFHPITPELSREIEKSIFDKAHRILQY